MQQFRSRGAQARVFSLFLFGLAGDAGAADQRTTDMWLEQAGFVMNPADTPAHERQMLALPPRRFIARTTPDGRRYYLYADPGDCKCVFVGNEQARANFKSISTAPPPQVDNVGPGGFSGQQLASEDPEDVDGSIFETDMFGIPIY